MTSPNAARAAHRSPETSVRAGGVTGASEARARDDLRLALSRRDLLVSDLAASEKAVVRARERAYGAEGEIERRERDAQKRKGAPLSEGDERALVDSIMGGGALVEVEEKESPDPELDRMKAEAAALRLAVEKLVGRLPERRQQVPFAEDAVKAAVKTVVGSSAALAKLLEETEELSLELVRRKAILVAVIDFLPEDSAELARAAALLQPSVYPTRHPEAESWRQACESLARDADAKLPAMEELYP